MDLPKERITEYESANLLKDTLSEYSSLEKLVRKGGLSEFLDVYARARDSMKHSYADAHNMEENVDIPVQFILKAIKDIERELSSLSNRNREQEILLHDNVSCNLCSKFNFTPIKGPRFVCLICSNYDLCSKCRTEQKKQKESDGYHAFSHPMMEIKVPSLIETLNKKVFWSDLYEPLGSLGIREESATCRKSLRSEISSKEQAFAGCGDTLPKFGCDSKDKSDEKSIFDGEKNAREHSLGTAFTEIQHTEKSKGLSVIEDHQRPAYTNDRSLLLLMKKLTPNSTVLSLTLRNDSNTSIVGNFMLELSKGSHCERVIVENDKPILTGTNRRFNIRDISHNSNLISNGELKLLTLNEVYHNRSLRLNDYNKLYLIKGAAIGPMQNFLTEICSICIAPRLQNSSQVILRNITETVLDFSNLKLKIVDCFGAMISKAQIMSSKQVEPKRTLKINIALDAKYLKHPFKLVVKTKQFKGECYMTKEKQNGLLRTDSRNLNDGVQFLQEEFDPLAICEICNTGGCFARIQQKCTCEDNTYNAQLNHSNCECESRENTCSNEEKCFYNDSDFDIISQEDLSHDALSDFEYLSSTNEEI